MLQVENGDVGVQLSIQELNEQGESLKCILGGISAQVESSSATGKREGHVDDDDNQSVIQANRVIYK